MLFLPEAVKVNNDDMHSMQLISDVELRLFGGLTTVEKKTGVKKIRYRLLREAVSDMVHVSYHSVFEVSEILSIKYKHKFTFCSSSVYI